jgi:hypothetical protein
VARIDILRPHVEKILGEYLQTDHLIVNDDGTIPIRAGSATYYVRLMEGEPPVLQVYSIVLEGVKKSMKLLEALNDINRQTFFAKVFWVDDDRVIATTELVAETLDKDEIANACGAIAWVADTYDTELQERFGGTMAGQDEPEGPPRG